VGTKVKVNAVTENYLATGTWNVGRARLHLSFPPPLSVSSRGGADVSAASPSPTLGGTGSSAVRLVLGGRGDDFLLRVADGKPDELKLLRWQGVDLQSTCVVAKYKS
jgi:hypothetical protein